MILTMFAAFALAPAAGKPGAYQCAVLYKGFAAVEVQSNPAFASTPVSLAARERADLLTTKAGMDPHDFKTNDKLTSDASDWVVKIPFEQDHAKKMAFAKDLLGKIKACDKAFALTPALTLTFVH